MEDHRHIALHGRRIELKARSVVINYNYEVSSHIHYVHTPSDRILTTSTIGEHINVGVKTVAMAENGREQHNM